MNIGKVFPSIDDIRSSLIASLVAGYFFFILQEVLYISDVFIHPYQNTSAQDFWVFFGLAGFGIQVILFCSWSLLGTVFWGGVFFAAIFAWPALGCAGCETKGLVPFSYEIWNFVFIGFGMLAISVISAWFGRASALIIIISWVFAGFSGATWVELLPALSEFVALEYSWIEWIQLLLIASGPYLFRLYQAIRLPN